MMIQAPIIRLPELMKTVGRGKSAIYQGMADGTFPTNIKLGRGARSVGWRRADVERWLADPAGYRAEAA
ncbi:hypothetical protein P350_13320 [Burkholderia cepacia JBK9]|nr:hypothetical protein P350_13320 [Burkholderia cepacia JBK9]